MDTIDSRVISTLKKSLGETDLRLDSDLIQTYPNIDSLDRAHIVMSLEEEFSIDIPDRDTEKFFKLGRGEYPIGETYEQVLVKDIVNYLSERTN